AGVGGRPAVAAGARASLGVDQLGLPRLPRLQGVPVPGVLRGLLRRHLQGVARWRLGDSPARDPAQLPQLGPAAAAADLLRPALREGRMIAIDVHLDADSAAAMARDVRRGLTAGPKELSPQSF